MVGVKGVGDGVVGKLFSGRKRRMCMRDRDIRVHHECVWREDRCIIVAAVLGLVQRRRIHLGIAETLDVLCGLFHSQTKVIHSNVTRHADSWNIGMRRSSFPPFR